MTTGEGKSAGRAASVIPAGQMAGGNAAASPFLREAALALLPAFIVVAFSGLLLLRDPHFFWHDDYQVYFLAGFQEVARAWSEGEFPLLSSCSWQGGALAGEYQYCVFSVFVTGCVLVAFWLGLPLPLTAAALSVAHLAVLASGAFCLARRRGLTPDLCLLVALVAALNGWIIIWGAAAWFPALTSFAWLPWVWWGLERALEPGRGPARFVPAGLFIYLVLTAGWPFTVLMIGLLTAWLLLRAGWEGRRWLPLWPVAAAWGVGLGLSAPAWLMLVEYSAHTARAQTSLGQLGREWMVPLTSLPGLVFPPWITFWKGFAGEWKKHLCAELSGGLVPVVVLAAAGYHLGRTALRGLRWEVGLCAVALVLAILPGLGNFRFSFRWLPFFFLVLGLIAAHALAALRAREGNGSSSVPPNLGLWATFLVLPVWLRAQLLALDPTWTTWHHGLLLLAICLGWAWVGFRSAPASRLRAWAPCMVVLASSFLTYLNVVRFMEVTTWQIGERSRQARLDPHLLYLSVHTSGDIFDGEDARVVDKVRGTGAGLLPGNCSMYGGEHLINGYSPMRPAGLAQLFDLSVWGFFHPKVADWLLAEQAGPDGLLARLGVDGLIVSDQLSDAGGNVETQGWRLVALAEGGQVFHREGEPSPKVWVVERAVAAADRNQAFEVLLPVEGGLGPRVLQTAGGGGTASALDLGRAEVTLVGESRNRVVAEVRRAAPDGEVLVAFRRPWLPGYQASCGGRPLSVEVLDLTLAAVRLPPGAEGRLVLEYRPRSLVLGMYLAAGAGAVVLLALLLGGLSARVRVNIGSPHQALLISERAVGTSAASLPGATEYARVPVAPPTYLEK